MESKEHKHHKASTRAKSKSNHNVLRSARKYISRHWKVVPIRPKEKVPRRQDWQNERIKKIEIPDYFDEGDNIESCGESRAIGLSMLISTGMRRLCSDRPSCRKQTGCTGGRRD
jgi:hypothetical protein